MTTDHIYPTILGMNDRANSRGQHFRWKVCNVRGDLFAGEELSHLIAERVAVVLKQVVLVAPENGEGRRKETDVQGEERERGQTEWRVTGKWQAKMR